MRYAFRLSAGIGVAIMLVGCATIITGTSEDVLIQSNPPRASITINGQPRGETPLQLDLDSDRSYMVQVKLEGYEPQSFQIERSTSGWMIGNLLFGGIPGLVIDAATGGMYVLEPTSVAAVLGKTETSALEMRVEMNVDTDAEKIAQLTPTVAK